MKVSYVLGLIAAVVAIDNNKSLKIYVFPTV